MDIDTVKSAERVHLMTAMMSAVKRPSKEWVLQLSNALIDLQARIIVEMALNNVLKTGDLKCQ